MALRRGRRRDIHRRNRALGRASRLGRTGQGRLELTSHARQCNRAATPQQACAYHHDSRHDGRDGGDAAHGRGVHARRKRLSGREGGGKHEQTDERHWCWFSQSKLQIEIPQNGIKKGIKKTLQSRTGSPTVACAPARGTPRFMRRIACQPPDDDGWAPLTASKAD